MKVIILSKDQYTELAARLDEITQRLNAKNEPKKDTFLDNQEFLLLMKISQRSTAQRKKCKRVGQNFVRKFRQKQHLVAFFSLVFQSFCSFLTKRISTAIPHAK